MPNINSPHLSNFEQREWFRETSGETGWTIEADEGGQVAVYEGRVVNHNEWAMKVQFDMEMPGLPLVGLHLTPATLSPPTQGLTVDVIRNITVGPLHAAVRDFLQLPFNTGAVPESERNEQGGIRRPGRGGRDPLFYAEWAARYLNACRKSEAPVAHLAEEHSFSEASIRGFLGEARRRGLLTPAPAGKAGGQLTDKAIALLADEDDKG